MYTDFGRVISRIEEHYKTLLLLYQCDKLQKLRVLFQVSRRLYHIAQEVTLLLTNVANKRGKKRLEANRIFPKMLETIVEHNVHV